MTAARSERGYRPGRADRASGQISREIFVSDQICAEAQERDSLRVRQFVGRASQILNPGG